MDTVTDLTFHSTLSKGYLNYDTPQWQIIDFRCITQAHPLLFWHRRDPAQVNRTQSTTTCHHAHLSFIVDVDGTKYEKKKEHTRACVGQPGINQDRYIQIPGTAHSL
jgi:hypothetical protein